MDDLPKQRIFISYGSQDEKLAVKFFTKLKKLGHQPYLSIASNHWGDDWPKRLDKELNECDFFLVLLSEESVKSRWVRQEISTVCKRKEDSSKPTILPIRVNFDQDLGFILSGYLKEIHHQTWSCDSDMKEIMGKFEELLLEQTIQKSQRVPQTESIHEANPQTDKPETAFLILRIKSSNNKPKDKKPCYFLSAWFDNTTFPEPLLINDETGEGFTEEQLTKELGQLIEKCREELENRNLEIEVFTSKDCLEGSYDCWKYEFLDVEEKLCESYSLHLRWTERWRLSKKSEGVTERLKSMLYKVYGSNAFKVK